MSQICRACGRGALSGNSRSKSMVATKTFRKINLQSRRLNGSRVKICTHCLKTLSKNPEKIQTKTPIKRVFQRRTKKSS